MNLLKTYRALALKTVLAALIFLPSTGQALAQETYKIGDLTITSPIARATPPSAPVAGGYLTIMNHGSNSAYLIGGKTSFAKKVEIHEMSMTNDVMKMRELPQGLEIPSNGSVELKPGGYHIMFKKLEQQLKPGETHAVTLQFKNAGELLVNFHVKSHMEIMKHQKMAHDHKMKPKKQ